MPQMHRLSLARNLYDVIYDYTIQMTRCVVVLGNSDAYQLLSTNSFEQRVSMEHKFFSDHWNQETFELKYSRKQPQVEKLCNIEKVKLKLLPRNMLKSVLSFFPILHWLPRYNWKKDLNGDIIGGLTVGIIQEWHMQVWLVFPSLRDLYIIFTSIFYMFFGTSRHVSIGVFAVASLMVGAVRLRFMPDSNIIFEVINGTSIELLKPIAGPIDFGYEVSPIMLASTLAMTVGLFQLGMAVIGLAFFTIYMSDAFISGFTTGAAFHVFIAQLNKIIGVKLPRHSGFGMLFFMMRDLMLALPQANYWAVILITIFSVYMDLKKKYGVKIVDYIPRGVPTPSLPNFDLVPYLFRDAFAIAIISYMFVISMAKLFAKKRRYKIDPTQDLYAVGLMHILSSFFPIFPAGGSLSRSTVCEQSGANTQLHALFSSALLLAVIAFIGPFLESLPMCVLACIVIVSLRSLFMQFRELSKLWRISKFDFVSSMVSKLYSNGVLRCNDWPYDISLFTLISVVLREQRPNIFIMGRAIHREVYKPLVYYPDLKPVNENIEIIRFEAPLNFLTVSTFLDKMNEVLKSNANQDCELQSMKTHTTELRRIVAKEAMVTNNTKQQQPWYEMASPGIVIIDCGAISNIDTMGIGAIKEVYLQGKEVNKTVLFADISETIQDAFERIDFYSSVPKTSFYPSLVEAVHAANNDVI
ncbi:Sulfate permease [Dirofilaria immitis]|nr:Sulfate permease [Dirofilaria immitis]